MLNDPLSNMMSCIMNAERVGKKVTTVRPVSKLMKAVLIVLNESLYVGSYEEAKDTRGPFLTINLLNRINQCGAIKPRHAVTKDDYERFEKRYLPGKNFGVLVVSTSKGLITHNQAKELGIGGRLIAYCY